MGELVSKTGLKVDIERLESCINEIIDAHPEFYIKQVMNITSHADMNDKLYDIPVYLKSKSLGKVGGMYPNFVEIPDTGSRTEFTSFALGDGVGFSERELTDVNEIFTNTYVEEVYNMLRERFNVSFARLLLAKPSFVYPTHRDLSPMRYHIAIDTHPSCLFLYPEHTKMYHVPKDGVVYAVDTEELHTHVNASVDCMRIHFVASVDYFD